MIITHKYEVDCNIEHARAKVAIFIIDKPPWALLALTSYPAGPLSDRNVVQVPITACQLRALADSCDLAAQAMRKLEVQVDSEVPR